MRIGIALVIAILSCGMASAGDKCFSSVKVLDAMIEQTGKSIPKIFDEPLKLVKVGKPPGILFKGGGANGDERIVDDLQLSDGAVIGPVGTRAAGDTVGPVTQEVGPETYMPSLKEIRENAGNPFDYYHPVTSEVGPEYTLSPKKIRENAGNPVTQEE
jgi:hypothetical protein